MRARVRVTGVVQGVGFRPFAYRLARELALSGFVRNDSSGVLAEVQGDAGAVRAFCTRLASEAPPLAVVERVSRRAVAVHAGSSDFAIVASDGAGEADAPVSADSATCEDCLGELGDPADRRHRYPFINCTNCGPRFTIVAGVPYDRPRTSMAGFVMCPACQAEYDDPADRRFHAQPNACPDCGPRVTLVPTTPRAADPIRGADPIRAAAAALAAGEILAVKGIGGYHLACRGDEEAVVARLRARKHREDKPFALMVASLRAAETLVTLGATERALLSAAARPIVLAPRRPEAPVATSVAPGAAELGVMLPYSPLHHLLLADLRALGVDALVLTSGNVSDEPIAYEDDDAHERLRAIADRFLTHDRPILTRTDDSVVRVVKGAASRGPRAHPLIVRRSRGYVPAALPLAGGTPRPLLGVGPELKHTFCLARGGRAWVSHHIGDLRNYETLRSFTSGVSHLARLFAVDPAVVAHDLHPDYLSTRVATELEGVALISVQHHHAHLAACLAEHGESGPAVGAIYDGAGYGTDGTVWGGELLYGDLSACERVGHLRPVRLPGGDRAVRQPWRMACAWLSEARGPYPLVPATLRGAVADDAWHSVADLAHRGFNSPPTSSMGRLFDAVAALCGVRPAVTYEGQAAIELEAACGPAAAPYPWAVESGGEGLILDPRAAVREVLADLEAGTSVATVAARFHATVAEATVDACARACARRDTRTVVLSGGVFLNRRLLEATVAGLHARDLRVLVPQRLPPGDGGIAFGQVAVAAARLREDGT